MIFAVADLLQYQLRLGHYGDDPHKNILALGHVRRVADETLRFLAPGDMIICQRMNSLLSWAVMYFGGGYPVDHVAIYTGNAKVLHMTFSGVKEHSIHTLARGARLLPFRPFGLDDSDEEIAQSLPELTQRARVNRDSGASIPNLGTGAHVLPPRIQLLLAGIEIVLGLRPTLFRWRYYLDVGFLAALTDLLLWQLNQFPIASTIWFAWLMVLVRMRILFRKKLRLGQRIEPGSHPGFSLRMMQTQGGHIFPGEPISGRWKIRVWPLWVDPSSRQQKVPQ